MEHPEKLKLFNMSFFRLQIIFSDKNNFLLHWKIQNKLVKAIILMLLGRSKSVVLWYLYFFGILYTFLSAFLFERPLTFKVNVLLDLCHVLLLQEGNTSIIASRKGLSLDQNPA